MGMVPGSPTKGEFLNGRQRMPDRKPGEKMEMTEVWDNIVPICQQPLALPQPVSRHVHSSAWFSIIRSAKTCNLRYDTSRMAQSRKNETRAMQNNPISILSEI